MERDPRADKRDRLGGSTDRRHEVGIRHAARQQVVPIVERLEVEFRSVLRGMRTEVGAELGAALVAEAARVTDGDELRLRLVDEDAADTAIDHHLDGLLDVLRVGGLVRARQIADVIVTRDHQPAGEDVLALQGFALQGHQIIDDYLAIPRPQALRQEVFHGREEGGIPILRKLPDADPLLLPHAPRDVHAQDLGLVVGELSRELPQLRLPHDAVNGDAPLGALGSEFGVTQESIRTQSGRRRLIDFLVQERQPDARAAHARPDQDRPLHVHDVLNHLHALHGEARMIVGHITVPRRVV